MNVPIITQVTLKSNEELIKRTKQQRRRSFYMVGKQALINKSEKGQKPDWQWEGIDFIDTFAAMTKREQQIVRLVKNCIKWDKSINSLSYIVNLPPDSVEFDPAADDSMVYSSFIKGYGLLHKKDLLRRVSKHRYMFNPEFFVPTGELAAHYEIVWNESKRHGAK